MISFFDLWDFKSLWFFFKFREPGYIDGDGTFRPTITQKRIDAEKEKELAKIKRVEEDIFGTELLCYVLEVLIGAAGIFDKNLCQNTKGMHLFIFLYNYSIT